jgi:lysophospholipase
MGFVSVAGNEAPEGAEEHWLEGRGGVKVRALTAPAASASVRGSVIVAPGRTEFIEKYFEVLRELQQRGFAVFCIDWRGQGLSGREVGSGAKGHLASFDDPVNDLATALKLLAPKLPRPHIGLAHSMGGAILMRALQTRRVELDAAAFSAPMWGVAKLGGMAKRYSRFMTAVGAGGFYAPGVQTRWKREPFKKNPVTHDKTRHARCQDLVTQEPRLALAGPTLGWVASAADVTEAIGQPSASAHLRIPILVASAGREKLVDNASHGAVVAQLPDAEHIVVDGARHEILMEKDELRGQFWQAFDRLAARVAPVPVQA